MSNSKTPTQTTTNTSATQGLKVQTKLKAGTFQFGTSN